MKRFSLSLLLLFSFFANAQQQFTVYFDFDSAEPTGSSAVKLNDWINKNKDAAVFKVYGYADKTGNSLYNIDLSERRMRYVYNALVSAGIDVTETEQKGFGESMAHAQRVAHDRRVTIYYTLPISPEEFRPNKAESDAFEKKIANAKVGDVIVIPNLNFYNNSDVVLPESQPVLDKLLQIMIDNPKIVIDIQGHICCEPEDEYKVSLQRAVAVYNFLAQNGVGATRLHYISFGSSKPLYPLPEENEEQRTANRRVEIKILKR